LLGQASEAGITQLISRISDTNAASTAFCERFEFRPYLHMVNLELDLMNWNNTTFGSKLHELTDKGIKFMTYADYEDTDPNRQRLYLLNKTLSATVPRDEPQTFMDFKTYVESQLSRDTCPHNGIYLAVDGDDWVGMTQISLHEGYAFIEMTGVLPSHRGQGIAQALKLLTVQFVQQNHRRVIRTFNDVSNAPMIAVNELSGFQKRGGFYQVRRKLV
jgi:RimJ/RimL family protein N-acetyltransferase